ncbi:hypothetical protein SAMN04487972_10625 [Paracoccus halophilus]|uniref:Transmembrane protein n=1 Tax=Paracoccus halophilus TaxID=376733 RepID=A0A099F4X4_9RHOB|nr:hypothetical protein [Paracoccus halophilus]KGJ05323.1 hypothetical protein IT41_05980 [Paracoccus halophilus]SFA48643.1 hypothetical protein SAMN04487972_10625 [Paracoccus halophilus]
MRGLLLIFVGLAAYAAMLFASQRLLAAGIEARPARILIALSPMLPAAFICGAVVWSIRQMDELQRKLQFEALALSFSGTALITFGYGFLEGAGFPKISMFAVWPLMAAIWFVGVVIGRLRFK